MNEKQKNATKAVHLRNKLEESVGQKQVNGTFHGKMFLGVSAPNENTPFMYIPN